MKVKIILNPAAGNGGAGRLADTVRRNLGAHSVELFVTTGPNDATAEAAKSAGFDMVIAMGGDGTINEVVNGLPRGVILGIIPMGTANVIALELGLPLNDPAKVATILANPEVIPFDTGCVGGRKFLLCSGFGMDAEVVRSVNPTLKSIIHKGAYVQAMAVKLLTHTPPRQIVTIDGQKKYNSYLTIVLNTSRYAGEFVLCPGASPCDGLLDVLIVKRGDPLFLAGLVPRALAGRGVAGRGVEVVKAKEVSVVSARPVPYQVDGDFAGTTPALISVCSGILQIAGPPGIGRRLGL